MIDTRRAFLLAVLVFAPRPALADTDDDDSASCPLATGTPVCDEQTDVVGYRRCTAYGTWGYNLLDPYVFVDLGMNVRHFGGAGASGVAFRSTTPGGVSPHPDEALTVDERIGFGLTRGLYLALDFELGNFAAYDPSKATSRDVVLDGLASLGFRVGLPPGSLAVEIAGGAMAYSYPTENDFRTEAVVEARGRAEVWLSPWISLGGSVGAGLLRQGDWMAGLYLGFHTYAYAGDR